MRGANSRRHLSHSTAATSALSAKLEQMFPGERAILVGRAAFGLVAALTAWRGGRPNCRVAMPAAICHEVLLAVLAAGCEPVFCDIDVADGLVPETEWTRARALGAEVAIVVHLYGNAARLKAARLIFPSPDCLLVDDAAQALGARSVDGPCGALGDMGLLSFGHSKQISIGNGVVLVKSMEFAARIAAQLAAIPVCDDASRSQLQGAFRSRLDAARAQLIASARADTRGFPGLLDGLGDTLSVALDGALSAALLDAVDGYPENARARIEKAGFWKDSLEGSGVVAVGMGKGSVPWRFVCRVPGIDWRAQARIAQAIRDHGIHVSNWYLPANWYIGQPVGALPGTETLSREVFQFWLDEHVTRGSILDSAQVIRRVLMEHFRSGAGP